MAEPANKLDFGCGVPRNLWAVLNATVIAFSLVLAISLALAIASDIMDEVAREKGGSTVKQSNPHRRGVNDILTNDELEMLIKPSLR